MPHGNHDVSFIVAGGVKLICDDGPLTGEVAEFYFAGGFFTSNLRPSWAHRATAPFPAVRFATPAFRLPQTTVHTLEKCALLRFDYRVIERLAAKHAQWGEIHAAVLWAHIEGLLYNITTLRGKDAAARYQQLMQRGGLKNRLNQSEIASYLGISRETLNRIVRRIDSHVAG